MEIELIIFRVQNQQFGIELKSIHRIPTLSINKKIKKIHFEGAEIPVIDLVSYFKLKNQKTSGKKEVIIIKLDWIKKGLLVDEILDILSLNLDNVKVIPSFIKTTAKKNYFWAIAQVENELILLLDIRKFII